MGVNLEVVFAATVTAEAAFALPERLNSARTVVAACRAYYQHMKPCMPSLELHAWRWAGWATRAEVERAGWQGYIKGEAPGPGENRKRR